MGLGTPHQITPWDRVGDPPYKWGLIPGGGVQEHQGGSQDPGQGVRQQFVTE